MREAKAAAEAIGLLRHARAPVPQISDDVGLWLPARAVGALRAHGIATLADLTVRIPRRRQWWRAIAPRHGRCAAHRGVFAAHPALTERARALIAATPRGSIVPWSNEAAARGRRLGRHLPSAARDQHARCGQRLRGRARVAVAARIGRDTAGVPEGGRAADPVGDRRARPRVVVADDRGCGRVSRSCARHRTSAGSGPCGRAARPTGGRSRVRCPRARPPTLSVLGALFRWLIEQRYLLANPFARSTRRMRSPKASGCSVRTIADEPSSAGHAGRAPHRLDAGRRATAALHSRFRLCDRAARERSWSARRSATSRPMRTATRG